jgi:GABA(A) receptor-associated protein
MFNNLSLNRNSFKKQYPFEKRFNESKRVLEQYTNKIPIICEKSNSQSNLPEIDKIKYLVPIDFNVGQFIYIIRNRMKLRSEEALFLIIGNNIFSSSTMLGPLYDCYKDKDGFLYIQYCKENTFG